MTALLQSAAAWALLGLIVAAVVTLAREAMS